MLEIYFGITGIIHYLIVRKIAHFNSKYSHLIYLLVEILFPIVIYFSFKSIYLSLTISHIVTLLLLYLLTDANLIFTTIFSYAIPYFVDSLIYYYFMYGLHLHNYAILISNRFYTYIFIMKFVEIIVILILPNKINLEKISNKPIYLMDSFLLVIYVSYLYNSYLLMNNTNLHYSYLISIFTFVIYLYLYLSINKYLHQLNLRELKVLNNESAEHELQEMKRIYDENKILYHNIQHLSLNDTNMNIPLVSDNQTINRIYNYNQNRYTNIKWHIFCETNMKDIDQMDLSIVFGEIMQITASHTSNEIMIRLKEIKGFYEFKFDYDDGNLDMHMFRNIHSIVDKHYGSIQIQEHTLLVYLRKDG